MSQLECDPRALSNYFDDLVRGNGKRGSSFTDIDAVTHDKETDRFLFQEFKRINEPFSDGQRLALVALAHHDPAITVWYIRMCKNGQLDWCDLANGRHEIIAVSEYQARFRRWWKGDIKGLGFPGYQLQRQPVATADPDDVPVLTEAERWQNQGFVLFGDFDS